MSANTTKTNFKSKRTRKKTDKLVNNLQSAVNNMSSSDSEQNDNFQKGNNNRILKPIKYKFKTEITKTVKEDDDIVLFKYNKLNDDAHLNALKAKQLQKKREIRSVLLFVFFLFVTILTLSQILVMHSQKNNSNFNQIKLMQEELKLMDYTIDKMLRENNVLPMQIWYSLKQYNDNLKKFSNLMNEINYFSSSNLTNTSNTVDDLLNGLAVCNQNILSQHLIQLIKNQTSITNQTVSNENNKAIKTTYYDNLELLLKDFLNKLNSTNSTSHPNESQCIHNILIAFYYLFNEQFSEFYENNFQLRQILLNRTEFFNQTFGSFLKSDIHHSNINNNSLLLSSNNIQFPIRELKKKFDLKSTDNLCDAQPPILFGPLNVTEKKYSKLLIDVLEQNNFEVKMGGSWSPNNCQARHKIAIIIPYRDRLGHLVTLLSYLHPILQRQQLDYKIFVTEQWGNGTFNKAIIMNAAFIYAYDHENYDCYCFHDVDLVPEDDRNMYSCGRNPKHMSIGVDEMNYKLQYEELIGGVLILKTEHLIASNGYSNLYWGWGAEDDDLYYRLKGLGYKIERPPLKIGRYRMMKHQKRKPQLWSKRAKLLYSSVNRMTWDGISSANYTLLKVTVHKLYTHLLIDVGVPPAGFN